MKAEIGYSNIVMGSFIEDLIGDIEWNMRAVELDDPYFEQLSIEKFTLEYLLKEISQNDDISSTEIVAQFAQKMSYSVDENPDPSCDFIFSISRDIARSLLILYLDDF